MLQVLFHQATKIVISMAKTINKLTADKFEAAVGLKAHNGGRLFEFSTVLFQVDYVIHSIDDLLIYLPEILRRRLPAYISRGGYKRFAKSLYQLLTEVVPCHPYTHAAVFADNSR